MAIAENAQHGPLRPRTVSVPSCRPRQRHGCTGLVRPCGPGAGEGQPTATVGGPRRLRRSRSRRPINASGSGRAADGLGCGHGRSGSRMAERHRQADPSVVQCGAGLACSPPCSMEDLRPSARAFALAHGVDGPCQWRRQQGQSLALAVWFCHARAGFLAGGMVTPAPPGGCGEGPRPIGVAKLRAPGARARARRFVGTRAEATVGDARLPPGEAPDGMDVRPQHATQARPDTRD
jgi:hypothetical protein